MSQSLKVSAFGDSYWIYRACELVFFNNLYTFGDIFIVDLVAIFNQIFARTMSSAGLFAFLYYLLMSIFATICTAFWSLHRSKLSSSQSLSHFQWIANSYQLAIWLKRGMFWNQVHQKSSPSPNHHSQNQNKSSIMIAEKIL